MPAGRSKGGGKTPGSGRKKGSLNKATVEAKEFLKGIIDSPDYRENFRERAAAGQLGPAMERYMWELLAGKPRDEPQDVNALVRVMFGGCHMPDEER